MHLEINRSIDTRLTPEDFVPNGILGDRYRLRRTIGAGGMSVVFAAEHLFTGDMVAIKTLLPEHRHAPDLRERMLRESSVLGGLRHPNVVSIVDAGMTADGAPYLVLEKLDGRPLDGVVRMRKRVSEAEALHIVYRVALAVAAAHERGVLHRDIKPSNVMIVHGGATRRGESVRLIDFGVASTRPADGRAKLTAAGMAVGTPEYLAPEQLLGQAASIQTEVYALGLLLFECLTGELPFSGNYARRLLQITTGPSPVAKLEWKHVSSNVTAILARALARETSQRFATAREFADAIVRCGSAIPELRVLRGAPPPPAPERAARRYVRAAYVSPLHCRIDDRAFEGQSADISEGGVLCFLRAPVAPGSTVSIRLTAPLSGRSVETRALVRWTRPIDIGHRACCAAGLEFLDLDVDAADEIRRFVATLSPASDTTVRPNGTDIVPLS